MKFDEIRLKFDEDEEVRALALYFQGPRTIYGLGPRAYRFLQKRYVLPHPRTLRRKMEKYRCDLAFMTLSWLS